MSNSERSTVHLSRISDAATIGAPSPRFLLSHEDVLLLIFSLLGVFSEAKPDGGLSSADRGEVGFLCRCGLENLLVAALASLNMSEKTRLGIGDFALRFGFGVGFDTSPMTFIDALRALESSTGGPASCE
uniref:Uncharacterized protein n=1 Tax=Setaria viridis TaxID=4556 RepID=A0A4U6WAF2_SETVI|nr:hypothetical protein SEVIR_1G137100v2 [Setaria viridis]